jgi:DMSO reductase anchor subunit
MKVILLFLLLMVAGFVLTSTGTAPSGFQDALFGSGILLWVVGIFGSVYCIVRRIAGPQVAKLAVLVLFLILLGEVIFGRRKNHELFEARE